MILFRDDFQGWTTVDDTVMGGVSDGAWTVNEAGHGVFFGEVSLENNGGFSSVRTTFAPLDLSAYQGIEITVRGDGQIYGVNLRDVHSKISYRASFETVADEWQTLRFAFDDLRPLRKGKPVTDAAPLATTDVRMVGFIISRKQAGPFRLEVARIAAC